MTLFYPLYIRRSDGKPQFTISGSRTALNAPNIGQIDQRPNAKGQCDFFRPINLKDPKHVDWRRKLAGMLMREVGGPSEKNKSCILAELPENYVLYERVKYQVDLSQPTQKDPTVVDRSDAYLYGHPTGVKRRYRSPADFFPHLLWLVTDEKGDSDNCSCKFCSPNEIQLPEDKEVKRVRVVATAPKPAPIVISKMSLSQSSASSVLSAQSRLMLSIRPPSAASPLTPSLPMSADHKIDLQYGKALFRQGEVVWYDRGQAWGLGVISRRTFKANPSSTKIPLVSYVVQPFSYPQAYPPDVTLDKQTQLRPWLAWSAPPYTHKTFGSLPEMSFENADWEGMLRGAYGPGDIQVDASILAARMVDRSYTLIEPIKSSKPGADSEERRWNGIFLGAEKIWVGEAVRLVTSDASLLVVQEIVERKTNGNISSVDFIGDAYAYSSIPVREKPATLPHRVWEDLIFRNTMPLKMSGGVSRPSAYMKLLYSRYQISISSIKGRWYESSLLLPVIMDTKSWETRVVKGEIDDSGKWLNSKSTPSKRTSTRRDSLERSVPVSFTVFNYHEQPSEPGTPAAIQSPASHPQAVQPPPPQSQQPTPPQQQPPQQQLQQQQREELLKQQQLDEQKRHEQLLLQQQEQKNQARLEDQAQEQLQNEKRNQTLQGQEEEEQLRHGTKEINHPSSETQDLQLQHQLQHQLQLQHNQQPISQSIQMNIPASQPGNPQSPSTTTSVSQFDFPHNVAAWSQMPVNTGIITAPITGQSDFPMFPTLVDSNMDNTHPLPFSTAGGLDPSFDLTVSGTHDMWPHNTSQPSGQPGLTGDPTQDHIYEQFLNIDPSALDDPQLYELDSWGGQN